MTTTTEDVVTHRDAMLDVFTEITQDCVLLGVTPCSVWINRWSSGTVDANVQFPGTDTDAVDQLAATYGFGPAAEGHPNYQRSGLADLDSVLAVRVQVFTGRPKAPAFPAGYAPQAVEA